LQILVNRAISKYGHRGSNLPSRALPPIRNWKCDRVLEPQILTLPRRSLTHTYKFITFLAISQEVVTARVEFRCCERQRQRWQHSGFALAQTHPLDIIAEPDSVIA
jgi:hypothetical protein